MNCSICGKGITLIPSAVERAKKYGGKPSDYTKLFTAHLTCIVEKRNKDVSALIARNASNG